MKKLLTLSIVTGALIALGAAIAPGAALADGDVSAAEEPCKRTDYKTEMVKAACEAGGQKAAAKAMKAFTKRINKELGEKDVNCKTCHTDMAPDYPNTPDAMKLFKDYQKKLKQKSAHAAPADREALTAFVRGS